jgi:hypothetical protein
MPRRAKQAAQGQRRRRQRRRRRQQQELEVAWSFVARGGGGCHDHRCAGGRMQSRRRGGSGRSRLVHAVDDPRVSQLHEKIRGAAIAAGATRRTSLSG